MEEARTEEPTPRRLAAAGRAELRSPDLSAALLLCTLIAVLFAWGARMQAALLALLRSGLAAARASVPPTHVSMLEPLRELAWLTSGLLLGLFLAGWLAALVQGGLPPRRGDRGTRTGSAERLRALLSAERFLDGALAALKAAVLLTVAGFVLEPALRGLLGLVAGGAARAHTVLLTLLAELLLRLGAVAVLLGAADQVYRQVRRRARLRMTRRERSFELRESHGAPELRAARDRLRREARAQLELAGLAGAGVLLLDGAGRALGLGLAPEDPAPRILAKAQGELAERLRGRAEQEGIAVRLDPALVAGLFPLELTELVPRARYEAVAELFRGLGEGGRKPT